MPCSAGTLAFLTLVAALVQAVSAQISNVTCPYEYAWMSNSKSQSPCLVAAYLRSVCATFPSTTSVETLPPYHHYVLRPDTTNDCSCNTVTYTLMSACATCQGRESLPWSTWKTNCTNAFVSQYPKPIPQGTAIPAWAYYNLVSTDSFNATIAEDIAQEKLLDSVAVPAPTMSLSSNNSNPPSADDDSKSSVSKTNNLAPIISGVVGSIVLVAIVAATTLLWRRQRKIMRATSCKSDTEKGEGGTIASAVSETTAIGENASTLPTKLYDPEDPSTFPIAALRQDTRIYQPIRFNGHAEL